MKVFVHGALEPNIGREKQWKDIYQNVSHNLYEKWDG